MITESFHILTYFFSTITTKAKHHSSSSNTNILYTQFILKYLTAKKIILSHAYTAFNKRKLKFHLKMQFS